MSYSMNRKGVQFGPLVFGEAAQIKFNCQLFLCHFPYHQYPLVPPHAVAIFLLSISRRFRRRHTMHGRTCLHNSYLRLIPAASLQEPVTYVDFIWGEITGGWGSQNIMIAQTVMQYNNESNVKFKPLATPPLHSNLQLKLFTKENWSMLSQEIEVPVDKIVPVHHPDSHPLWRCSPTLRILTLPDAIRSERDCCHSVVWGRAACCCEMATLMVPGTTLLTCTCTIPVARLASMYCFLA